MPKKIIPVPSDFARPKPGTYIKKSDDTPRTNKPKVKKKFTSTSGPRRFEDAKHPTDKSFIESKRPNQHIKRKDSFDATKKGQPSKERLQNPYREENLATKKPLKAERGVEKVKEQMPLNKYIAHCGICSRRDAISLIKEGKVKVNNKIEKEPGYKVLDNDVILFEDKKIVPQQKLVYFLLNKPKDFITTTDDPEGRKTVMDLFKNVTDARIFPVGRLDRNTTGLLLLTNDGELTQKLSHPKHNTKKVYQVGLDKPLTKNDFAAIAKGLLLEDGLAEVDEIAYINPKDKREVGIEIHSGRNRIVRRIFEHLHYEVKTLDRVIYAGLTKKNLPRGKFRALEPQEIIFLKHFK